MIRYNVSFSLKHHVDEQNALDGVTAFLTDLRSRGLIRNFTLLRVADATWPLRASIAFDNERQFGLPFEEVQRIGIHVGAHGTMIEGVEGFSVETIKDAAIIELQTPRLTLRQWRSEDREPFAALNADADVMEFFPSVLSRPQSDALADRIEGNIAERGWGLWAVEVPGVAPFIGFVGLAVPEGMPFSPAVEVGWRLSKQCWGAGYATEGAKEALRFAFQALNLRDVVSLTVPGNVRSRRVMEKLGIANDPADDFDHPRIPEGHPFRRHVLYRIKSTS
jgi:RimJ/RimL family protein N-acetyltransferase